ncbi:hypothetical protein SODALDRAFT_347131 [Sodiomyces alkalinus F11]|uniref:Uncharacterized protein n=1 Tax=Sodiomyces alkalinus (strain CBS 110278 / VKM F-3762 / F11) TaxID=1314773 RepID=A0A3N2Q5V4_SODAK|nr:hypothetical protein SODALDRAFT_347131 [Sodiomyces alkalinus F11]ROT42038.1 hypothetical protein SODALDRAFT_347131 [Sodiomyces alkalinus F11]
MAPNDRIGEQGASDDSTGPRHQQRQEGQVFSNAKSVELQSAASQDQPAETPTTPAEQQESPAETEELNRAYDRPSAQFQAAGTGTFPLPGLEILIGTRSAETPTIPSFVFPEPIIPLQGSPGPTPAGGGNTAGGLITSEHIVENRLSSWRWNFPRPEPLSSDPLPPIRDSKQEAGSDEVDGIDDNSHGAGGLARDDASPDVNTPDEGCDVREDDEAAGHLIFESLDQGSLRSVIFTSAAITVVAVGVFLLWRRHR